MPWLCLALSLMTQPSVQSIIRQPDRATEVHCTSHIGTVLCIEPSIALVAAFRFQSISGQVTKHNALRDCI